MSARVAVSQHSASALSLLSRSLPPVPPPVIPSSGKKKSCDNVSGSVINSRVMIIL